MPELRASGWFALYRRLPTRSQAGSTELTEVLDRFRLAFGREPERCDYDPNEAGWWMGPISVAEMAAHRRRRAQGQMAMQQPAEAGPGPAGER